MNPRVKQVNPEPDYMLRLVFTNGESGLFDMKPYLSIGVFRELTDKSKFNSVQPFMGSIQWVGGQDLCPDTLYEGCSPCFKKESILKSKLPKIGFRRGWLSVKQISIVLFFSLMSRVGPSEENRIEILVLTEGEASVSATPVPPGSVTLWSGVYSINDFRALVSSSTVRVSDAFCPPDWPDADRVKVEIINEEVKGQPILLFRGLDVGPNREIETVPLSGNLNFYQQGQFASFLWRGEKYRIEARGSKTPPGTFDMFFLKGRISQRLPVEGFFDEPHLGLLWVGDLDRDGKPDLLMDMAPKYSYSRFVLFLSSMSQPSDLVGQAASCKVMYD